MSNGDEDKKTRAERATSNVFAKLPQKLMQEMKEAFTMIDQNRDGFIDLNDLREMYSSLGAVPQETVMKDMLKEAPGPLNFTMFLSLFSEKLSGTDPENTIQNAFSMFDDAGKGYLPEAYIKDLLQNMGDNFTQDEMRQTFKEAPVEGGKFDYNKFTAIIKGSNVED
ncbi:myosin regulatory light chain A, smooth adductor muscle-like isoform X1 [Mytilus galloprovincialis]|uniref:myosin regulatory light chain A, smooth adductor muscle-like isoform X1 n=1 Tax=Mytilus galloprovincialis TaxID=29158 RepID=UPI003F7C464C